MTLRAVIPFHDYLDYYLPLRRNESGLATNSDNGSRMLEPYEKSMPPLNGPPFHFECLLEAQEPQESAPFPGSIIGRLPVEIREQIYIYALRIEPVPEHIKYGWYGRRMSAEPRPEYHQDHMPVSRSYAQRRWPHGSSPSPALLATFPPRSKPHTRSRLALLLTCRQIYIEAWRLYYSTNNFDFRAARSMVHFCDNTTPARRRALTSVTITAGTYYPEENLQKALQYLVECDNLQELTLELNYHDECHFTLLRKLRGLRKVDVRLSGWNPTIEYGEKERVSGEVEELNKLLLRPKEES